MNMNTEKAKAGERTQHTPAPWMVDDETVNHGPIIIQRNGALEVAAVYGDGRDQRAANARLIAAAPELLEACKKIRSATHPTSDYFEIVNRAIVKAEGHKPGTVAAAIAKAEGK